MILSDDDDDDNEEQNDERDREDGTSNSIDKGNMNASDEEISPMKKKKINNKKEKAKDTKLKKFKKSKKSKPSTSTTNIMSFDLHQDDDGDKDSLEYTNKSPKKIKKKKKDVAKRPKMGFGGGNISHLMDDDDDDEDDNQHNNATNVDDVPVSVNYGKEEIERLRKQQRVYIVPTLSQPNEMEKTEEKEELKEKEDNVCVLQKDNEVEQQQDKEVNEAIVSDTEQYQIQLEDDNDESDWQAQIEKRAFGNTTTTNNNNITGEKIIKEDLIPPTASTSTKNISSIYTSLQNSMKQLDFEQNQIEKSVQRFKVELETSFGGSNSVNNIDGNTATAVKVNQSSRMKREENNTIINIQNDIEHLGKAYEYYQVLRNELVNHVGALRFIQLQHQQKLKQNHETTLCDWRLEFIQTQNDEMKHFEEYFNIVNDSDIKSNNISDNNTTSTDQFGRLAVTANSVDEFGRDLNHLVNIEITKRRSQTRLHHQKMLERFLSFPFSSQQQNTTFTMDGLDRLNVFEAAYLIHYYESSIENTNSTQHIASQTQLASTNKYASTNNLEGDDDDIILPKYKSLPKLLQLFRDWYVTYAEDFAQTFASLSLADLISVYIKNELEEFFDTPVFHNAVTNKGKQHQQQRQLQLQHQAFDKVKIIREMLESITTLSMSNNKDEESQLPLFKIMLHKDEITPSNILNDRDNGKTNEVVGIIKNEITKFEWYQHVTQLQMDKPSKGEEDLNNNASSSKETQSAASLSIKRILMRKTVVPHLLSYFQLIKSKEKTPTLTNASSSYNPFCIQETNHLAKYTESILEELISLQEQHQHCSSSSFSSDSTDDAPPQQQNQAEQKMIQNIQDTIFAYFKQLTNDLLSIPLTSLSSEKNSLEINNENLPTNCMTLTYSEIITKNKNEPSSSSPSLHLSTIASPKPKAEAIRFWISQVLKLHTIIIHFCHYWVPILSLAPTQKKDKAIAIWVLQDLINERFLQCLLIWKNNHNLQQQQQQQKKEQEDEETTTTTEKNKVDDEDELWKDDEEDEDGTQAKTINNTSDYADNKKNNLVYCKYLLCEIYEAVKRTGWLQQDDLMLYHSPLRVSISTVDSE